ncbi:MAG: hypothetical protein H6729_13535 [Deltaproteobacteria bacterium]|nr:hypothetical protein [Deltaproteobacteria bacterium]
MKRHDEIRWRTRCSGRIHVAVRYRGRRVLSLALVCVALGRCGGGDMRDGAKTDLTDPDRLATTRPALTLNNALEVNGLSSNGLYLNGLSFNAYAPNGLYVNGLPLNGLPLNGLYVNGLSENGIGDNGLPLNGLPLNGLYVNGLPLNGLPLNGLPLNGLYVNGLPLNGLYVNGLPVNGLSLNGLPLNGLYVNGLPLNGLYVNGLYPNGLYVNGLPLNGLPLNGLYVNGSTPETALRIANASGALVDLTAEQEAAFESMMGHLVWCALPESDAIMMYRSNGDPIVYPGFHGLAPAWKNSGLIDDPNGVDDSETLRWCVEHYRPIDSSGDVYPGLALNALQQSDLRKLLKYTVECALNPGDEVAIQLPSELTTFYGALGLAPGWKTGALDEQGQKAISACLAARTNALGATVRISLRGPYAGLAVTPLERAQFRHHEGAFWGNVFGDAPSLHACKAAGGGPAGRLCTDGSCGFSPDPLPNCNAPALGGCDSTDSDGNYTNCGSEVEDVVLNTFLMTENSMSFGENHTCARRQDGTVWCWGTNFFGELGDGTNIDRTEAVQVIGLPDPQDPKNDPRQFAGANSYSYVKLADGTIYAWGSNADGRLGDGTETNRSTAVRVDALAGTVASVTAGGAHACAVKMDGTLWCWGKNADGQIGDGTTSLSRLIPTRAGIVELGDQVAQVEAGFAHTCALKMDGTVWCWGTNSNGELGDGTQTRRLSPVRAGATELGHDVVQISLGWSLSCALKADGTVWCWGNNAQGQLGTGTFGGISSVPVQSGASMLVGQVTHLRAGRYHVVATKADGSLWCWGKNGSAECTSPAGNIATPRSIELPGSVRLGSGSTSAQLSDGSVWEWGSRPVPGTSQLQYDVRWSPIRTMQLVTPGDEICDFTESNIYEPLDCSETNGSGSSSLCGDSICASDETCSSCAIDCGACDACGDGVCSGAETCDACPADCAAPTFYLDADGDGFGNPSAVVQACSSPSGYVANGNDCDDASAANRPSAHELLDGLDNDCNGWIDDGINLLSNPNFDTDVAGWTASAGTFEHYLERGSADPSAMLTTSQVASVTEDVGAVGAGHYVVRVSAATTGRKATLSAYLQIEERTSAGVLVGVTESQLGNTSSKGGWINFFEARDVTEPTNTIRFRVVKTSGSVMLLDDAHLTRFSL